LTGEGAIMENEYAVDIDLREKKALKVVSTENQGQINLKAECLNCKGTEPNFYWELNAGQYFCGEELSVPRNSNVKCILDLNDSFKSCKIEVK